MVLGLQNVLNFDIKSSGFLSALPSLLMFIYKMIIGALSDWLKSFRPICCPYPSLKDWHHFRPPRVSWLRPTVSVKLFN